MKLPSFILCFVLSWNIKSQVLIELRFVLGIVLFCSSVLTLTPDVLNGLQSGFLITALFHSLLFVSSFHGGLIIDTLLKKKKSHSVFSSLR